MKHIIIMQFVLLFQLSNAQNLIEKKSYESNKILLNKWLNYYNIQLSDFKIKNSSKECINCTLSKNFKNSIYYIPFDDNEKTDTISNVYSPSKRKYVSLGVPLSFKDNKVYFSGEDCSRQAYLTDKDLKHTNLILVSDYSSIPDDIFWSKDEKHIYITGYQNFKGLRYYIYEFNLQKNIVTKYETNLISNKQRFSSGYFKNIYLKERNIIVD